ncbi:hypothetical protein PL75_05960 [Neisseria arctica]|uniref:Periplasmic protein n=1 Tax=Neisseria arctica TaxID=1470200 RepID=A0A0J0YRT1_9NEIS|nr:hypothetical protein [Neisseria arctica]KLT72841.1 hypothetical protein PL75_05960 [Neisseria arctica]UOO86553.1 hypothetical protein LVJ86_10255 [Neisseria arctica]
MKKLLCITLLAVSLPAWADAANDLLGAQAAFRQALSAQNSNGGKIVSLQRDLAAAQARLQQTQAEITRLEGELQAATAAKAQNDNALQEAGARLNAAWAAARASGTAQ